MRRGASGLLAALLIVSASMALGCQQNRRATTPPPAKSHPILTYEQSNGQILFEHYCAVCHGAGGAGDGFNAYNLQPARPQDFTDTEAMKKLTDQDLLTAIKKGGKAMGRSALMPAWGGTLNDRQVRYLIRYLRTLSAPSQTD